MSNRTSFTTTLVLLLSAILYTSPVVAEDHVNSLLEHTKAAANAKDSKSVAEHTTQALKHTEAAKAEVEPGTEAAKHLEKSEADLNSALKNAQRFNTNSAIKDAQDSHDHINKALGK
jgi:hypothetical protein